MALKIMESIELRNSLMSIVLSKIGDSFLKKILWFWHALSKQIIGLYDLGVFSMGVKY